MSTVWSAKLAYPELLTLMKLPSSSISILSAFCKLKASAYVLPISHPENSTSLKQISFPWSASQFKSRRVIVSGMMNFSVAIFFSSRSGEPLALGKVYLRQSR